MYWRPFLFRSGKSTTLKKRCGPSSASRRTCGRLLHHRPGRRTAPSLLHYLQFARRRTTRPSSTGWPPLEARAGPSRREARRRPHQGRGSAAWSPRGRARGPRRTSRARRRASWPCRGCGRRRRRPRTRCCSTATLPKSGTACAVIWHVSGTATAGRPRAGSSGTSCSGAWPARIRPTRWRSSRRSWACARRAARRGGRRPCCWTMPRHWRRESSAYC